MPRAGGFAFKNGRRTNTSRSEKINGNNRESRKKKGNYDQTKSEVRG